MREIYPLVAPGATFNKTDHVWHFPSGAEIYTSYMQQEDDRFRWQGFELQFVGFEELTQWPTDVPYRYLFSRLRTSNPNLKCLMRANCNPGGRGHKWVRERWNIGNEGGPTLSKQIVNLENGEQRLIARRFIPAKLFTIRTSAASTRPPCCCCPKWSGARSSRGVGTSSRYPAPSTKKRLRRRSSVGASAGCRMTPRCRCIGVDLGVSDHTAIWFVQSVATERRCIDYYEMNGEGLPHYAKILKDKPYIYGQHFGPHDIQVREFGSGRTRWETAAALGITFQITPNVSFEDGIHAARVVFPTVYFDSEKCARGIECVSNYRWNYNERLGEFLLKRPCMTNSATAANGGAFRYLALDVDLMHNAFGAWGGKLNYPKIGAA